MKKHTPIWSATPTPLTRDLELDIPSIPRMVEWHIGLGIDGIMVLGTCGEGPWMPERQKETLIRETVAAAQGRLGITVQTTDNSAARVLEQIEMAKRLGAGMATVAQPYFLINAKPANVERFYLDIFDRSPLPIAFYDRGRNAAVGVPDEMLPTLYAHPRVAMAKDSSSDPGRREIALAARRNRPELLLLNGDEFKCVEYLQAGYDGLMLGGAILNGRHVRATAEALQAGDEAKAREIDHAMTEMLFTAYGGRNISCWLSGLKETLVRLGVFSTHDNYLRYELTEECSREIDLMLERERAWWPAPAPALANA